MKPGVSETPRRRDTDSSVSKKADALIARLDEAVERLNKILIGDHSDDTEA